MTVASSGCSAFADTKAGGTADLSGEMAEANEPDETDAPANETGDKYICLDKRIHLFKISDELLYLNTL